MAAEGKKRAVKPRKKRRAKVAAATRGLLPAEVGDLAKPESISRLEREIEGDGGKVLRAYRDPLGGAWQVLAALPLDLVKPTSFQRNLSEAHVKRLGEKIERLNRFLDPIIAVRAEEGYLTPNGYHRSAAMGKLGAKSILAIVVPEKEIAYQILALNTEKAHNLREKSLEAIRMARELGRIAPGDQEIDYGLQFEEAPFLTLGACYEQKGLFAGGAYHPVLRRSDDFFEEKLPRALSLRAKMADKLLRLDERVARKVEELKEAGLKSPYLKTFVVARINPLRFRKSTALADFDDTLETMRENLDKLDVARIRPHHLAGMGGAPAED